MNIKNFVLSYYKNSADKFHIHKIDKPNEARRPHTHEYFQIYYVAHGSLSHFVSGTSSELCRGDMFIIPPGITHYIVPGDSTVFYSFSFMPDFMYESIAQGSLSSSFISRLTSSKASDIRPKVSVSPDEIIYIESIMENILKDFEKKPLGFNDSIRAYLALLISLIARIYYETTNEEVSANFNSNKEFVLHCIEYMENNFTDNISLNAITKRFAMSKSNFCSLFSKLTGYSFNQYLNICRIKKATEYIVNGYKITALYSLCGYNDFSTFYRNFKKITGTTPKDYQLKAKSTETK